jgi:hypothetical protein
VEAHVLPRSICRFFTASKVFLRRDEGEARAHHTWELEEMRNLPPADEVRFQLLALTGWLMAVVTRTFTLLRQREEALMIDGSMQTRCCSFLPSFPAPTDLEAASREKLTAT